MPWKKLQPVESPCQSRLLAGAVAYGEKSCRSKFLAGTMTHGRPTLEQSVPVGLYSLGKDPCWSSSERTAAHRKDPCWSTSWRTVSHGRDSTLEQGKRVRRKEQQSVMNWPQPPFPIPLHHSGGGGRRVANEGVKLSLERRDGGEWEGGFSFGFVSHYPTLFLTVNKLN